MGNNTTNLTVPQATDRAIEEIIQVARDCDGFDNLSSSSAVNYPKSRVGGQETAGGPEENWYRHNQPEQIDDTYIDKIATHAMQDLRNAGNPRDVIPEASRTLLLDMIYDDFAVCTRMSRLPGEDRMQGPRVPAPSRAAPRPILWPRPSTDPTWA